MRPARSLGAVAVNVARYLRVSRADQKADLQANETADFIARRGWTLVDTYEDLGFSGATDKRPGLTRLLADAHAGKFSLVCVWKADRLFRSLSHMVSTLDTFRAQRVGFVSVTEPFDTSTPSGTLLLQMVSAMAEFERSLLRERTRAGVAAAKARGVHVGRPFVAWEERRARLMVSEGRSVESIAKALHMSATTLRRRLRAPSIVVAKEEPTEIIDTSRGGLTLGEYRKQRDAITVLAEEP